MERKLLVKVILVSATSVLLTLLVVVGVAWAADIFTVDRDGTVRLVITDTGNVGIGKTNPGLRLDISGGMRSTDIGAGGNPQLIARGHPALDLGELGTLTNHDQIVITNATERMRITNAGNVGVGTTDPKTKLHVTGLPEYAGNAAAIAAGLTAGAFYRTGEFLKVVY